MPRRLWATAGVRADVYHASGVTLLGVDPRFQFRAKLLPQLTISGGIGLYQQPPSFPIALPGVDTFALQLGLQRAIQAAYSVEVELPQTVDAQASPATRSSSTTSTTRSSTSRRRWSAPRRRPSR